MNEDFNESIEAIKLRLKKLSAEIDQVPTELAKKEIAQAVSELEQVQAEAGIHPQKEEK